MDRDYNPVRVDIFGMDATEIDGLVPGSESEIGEPDSL
uniref:Uncharacterized protein n=1 Tax=Candidatus Kentrum sp. FW TaxID=2126338 RepID=A0A450S1Q1_9GAMM|nr:MAG: hypothetical protein BECKFW1821A_GA0114235_101045 [Candidatus Kentron sp. FW]